MARNEVKNFLIANALYWVEAVPHRWAACGCCRVDAVSGLWKRSDGEWVPNKYGGNKNLEAIEFFKHLNSRDAWTLSGHYDDCGGVYGMAEGDRKAGG